MQDTRYEIGAIRPLVSHENVTGRHLVVTFTCPASGKHVNARYTAPESSGVASAVASRAKQTAMYEVRRQAHSMLYRTLGGALGRIAVSAVDGFLGGTTGTGAPAPLGGVDRDAALVEAFRSVSGEFCWVGDRWLHASAAVERLSPLDRQLHEHPLRSAYDRTVAARISIEIAAAHGGISPEERSQLEDALDPALGSLDALLARPPLSKAELAETTSGPTRRTLLALGWSMALCDERFDEPERARLDEIAAGLGLPPTERDSARELARNWVLDQWFERAFSWGGHDTHLREEAVRLGERIGMSRAEVEAAEARFQRRRAG